MTDTATTPTSEASQPSGLYIVGTLVDQRVQKWQRDLLGSRPTLQAVSLATLARLRRGAGKAAGSVPDIFPFTVAPELAGTDAPDDPTPRETAAHIALTLYALHQQSRSKPMHKRGWGIGRALRQLHGPEDPTIPPDPVTRRFQILVTADDLDELSHHARGTVQLLRGTQTNAVPLDYGLLADELLRWQSVEGRAQVRRKWARDYYRPRRHTTTETATATSDTAGDSTEPEGN